MRVVCSLFVLVFAAACARVPTKVADTSADDLRVCAQATNKQDESDEVRKVLEEIEHEQAQQVPSRADSLRPWNLVWFHFNDKLYFWVAKPVSKAWGIILYPRFVRGSIHDFIVNLGFPGRFFNTALQGRLKASGTELIGFLANLTVGVAGLWDPATKLFHLKRYDEDFDQTLGVWGIGTGPFIIWPLLGPSSIRGTLGAVGDYCLDPLVRYSIVIVVRAINDTSLGLSEYESLIRLAVDPYTAVRDAYFENRRKVVGE